MLHPGGFDWDIFGEVSYGRKALSMIQSLIRSEGRGRLRDRAGGGVPRPTRPRKTARSAWSFPIRFSRLNAIFSASSVAPG